GGVDASTEGAPPPPGGPARVGAAGRGAVLVALAARVVAAEVAAVAVGSARQQVRVLELPRQLTPGDVLARQRDREAAAPGLAQRQPALAVDRLAGDLLLVPHPPQP